MIIINYIINVIENQISIYKDLWNHAAKYLNSLKFNFIGHHISYIYIPAKICIRYNSYHERNRIINIILFYDSIELYDKIPYNSKLNTLLLSNKKKAEIFSFLKKSLICCYLVDFLFSVPPYILLNNQTQTWE